MLVYHGSMASFGQFRIENGLVRNSSTLINEGKGIYFSTDKNIAKSYGKYLYTVNVDAPVIDYRYKANCAKYVSAVRKYIKDRNGVDISLYMDLGMIANSIYDGSVGIAKLPRELSLCLDSSYKFYELPQKLIDDTLAVLGSERIIKREFAKWNTAYMFTYNIPNCGVIKDARYAHIVKKEVVK